MLNFEIPSTIFKSKPGKMTAFRQSKNQLPKIESLMKNQQQHPIMSQVQNLRSKLKEEKIRDRIVYQSLKNKSSAN